MTTNRRSEARTRVFEGARVVFNGRQSVMACTIRNRSQTGALVRMSDWIALPDVFEVEIAGSTVSLRARQCWRRGDDVGVVFVADEDNRPAAPIDLAAFRAARAAAG